MSHVTLNAIARPADATSAATFRKNPSHPTCTGARGTDATPPFPPLAPPPPSPSLPGNFAAAIRDAESLRSRRDAEFGALYALAALHCAARVADAPARAAVDAALAGGAEDAASVGALVLAAHWAALTASADDAERFVTRALRENDAHAGAQTLSAWLAAAAGAPALLAPLGPLAIPPGGIPPAT
jgi:hypothetical protein